MSKEVVHEGKLNELIVTRKMRANGTLRLIHDYSNCPTMAEQHTAHVTDLNYLIKKYQPDELSAYLTARNQHRSEILGHDFSREPSLQDAKNRIIEMKNAFENLPDEVRKQFKNHVEFLKYIDHDKNAERLEKLGLLTKEEIQKLRGEPSEKPTTSKTTPTKEKEAKKEESKKGSTSGAE